MDDGIELATDIWRIDDNPRPVILRRTPYGRAQDDAQRWLAEGYTLVAQDVRGRGDSAGSFLPFATDEADGRATIAWITAQPWSNGRVGMYSMSAEGIVQFQAMASATPALACTSIRMASHDVYASMLPGGAWRTELDSAWLEGLEAGNVIPVWRAHEVRDRFWDGMTLSADEMKKVTHPVLIVGGFYDIFAPEQARIAHELPQYARDVTVVLGPWTHVNYELEQGELVYPSEARLPLDEEERAYFAWCLRGAPKPALPKVRYYLSELGERANGKFAMRGAWRHSELWPPAEVHVETLFLAGKDLQGRAASGAPIRLSIDPNDPAPTHGGGNFSVEAGPHEQTELDRRRDVYTATSAPLTETVELVGSPRALVWASSSTDDIDVVVRFEQVTPHGEVIAFADGLRRGRFVQGYDAIRPLTPGAPALFEVELGPIALRVNEGSSLRIAISGTSHPRYEPNPGRARPLSEGGRAIETTLSLHFDPARPSRLELPVLRGTLPVEPPSDHRALVFFGLAAAGAAVIWSRRRHKI